MKRLLNEKSELEYYKIRKPLSACKDKKTELFSPEFLYGLYQVAFTKCFLMMKYRIEEWY